MAIKKVCVYCASSEKIPEKYFQATTELADHLVDHEITVVFGGGSAGLMGALADQVLERDGRIIGIMPQFMKEVEWAHKGVPEFEFVGDMHERKKRFLEGVDALIALPGGCGTLEELMEAITLKRLGLFTEPIIILNLDGFYDPLVAMLDKCIEEQFMAPRHRDMWSVVERPEQVIPAIQSAPSWSKKAIQFAALRKDS